MCPIIMVIACSLTLAGHVGYWRTTDDVPYDQLATLKGLDPDTTYELRVVAKSDLGESASLVQEVVAGMDPGRNITQLTPTADTVKSRAKNQAIFNCLYMSLHKHT